MAVAQKPKPGADFNNVKANILTAIEELIDLHESEILEYMEEAETKKINVTFPVALDFSESKASGEVKMRFSQSVTDKRTFEIDPPEQVQMFGRDLEPATNGTPNENGHELTTEQTIERAKKRQRKGKAAAEEAEETTTEE